MHRRRPTARARSSNLALFAVPHDAGRATQAPAPPAHQVELLSWTDERTPSRENARITWVPRALRDAPATDVVTNPAALFKLWRQERRAARKLRAGIGAGLELLASASRGDAKFSTQQALVTASWRSRRLWSAEDRCLPRSLALAHLLREAGSGAKLALGVMGQPFAAHAWVQDGDVVLNDTLDHVRLFTPILIA